MSSRSSPGQRHRTKRTPSSSFCSSHRDSARNTWRKNVNVSSIARTANATWSVLPTGITGRSLALPKESHVGGELRRRLGGEQGGVPATKVPLMNRSAEWPRTDTDLVTLLQPYRPATKLRPMRTTLDTVSRLIRSDCEPLPPVRSVLSAFEYLRRSQGWW